MRTDSDISKKDWSKINTTIMVLKKMDKKNIRTLENNLKTTTKEDRYAKSVLDTKHNLEKHLSNLIKNIPQLNAKNENGRSSIHFHAFRAWFKT
jgi:hypothetical protein